MSSNPYGVSATHSTPPPHSSSPATSIREEAATNFNRLMKFVSQKDQLPQAGSPEDTELQEFLKPIINATFFIDGRPVTGVGLIEAGFAGTKLHDMYSFDKSALTLMLQLAIITQTLKNEGVGDDLINKALDSDELARDTGLYFDFAHSENELDSRLRARIAKLKETKTNADEPSLEERLAALKLSTSHLTDSAIHSRTSSDFSDSQSDYLDGVSTGDISDDDNEQFFSLPSSPSDTPYSTPTPSITTETPDLSELDVDLDTIAIDSREIAEGLKEDFGDYTFGYIFTQWKTTWPALESFGETTLYDICEESGFELYPAVVDKMEQINALLLFVADKNIETLHSIKDNVGMSDEDFDVFYFSKEFELFRTVIDCKQFTPFNDEDKAKIQNIMSSWLSSNDSSGYDSFDEVDDMDVAEALAPRVDELAFVSNRQANIDVLYKIKEEMAMTDQIFNIIFSNGSLKKFDSFFQSDTAPKLDETQISDLKSVMKKAAFGAKRELLFKA